MNYLFGILFIGLILFAIGGVIFFFILEDRQTIEHLKFLDRINNLKP